MKDVTQYDRYIRYMLHRRGLGSVTPEEREDLLQECRVAAWKAQERYDASKGTTVQTFVYHCVMHRISQLWDKKKHDVDAFNFSDLNPLHDIKQLGGDEGPDMHLENLLDEKRFDVVDEMQARMEGDELLSSCTEEEKLIFHLYANDFSFADIGARLGISRQAVHQRYRRIVLRIKAKVEKRRSCAPAPR